MQKHLYCPRCNKSDGLKISLAFDAFIRTSIDANGKIKTSEELEKLVGSQQVFGFYAGEEGKNKDETRVFLIHREDEEDKNVSVYCSRCSNIFQIKKSFVQYD